jgi:hypothetical protein
LASASRRALALHLLRLNLKALLQHRALGVHLGLTDLALLGLHRNLGVELVLLDCTLLLDRGIATQVKRVVGILENLFADGRFQRPSRVRRWLDGKDRQTHQFQTQGWQTVGLAQAVAHRLHQPFRLAQQVLQLLALQGGAQLDLHRVDHTLRQLRRVLGEVVRAVWLEGEVHQ